MGCCGVGDDGKRSINCDEDMGGDGVMWWKTWGQCWLFIDHSLAMLFEILLYIPVYHGYLAYGRLCAYNRPQGAQGAEGLPSPPGLCAHVRVCVCMCVSFPRVCMDVCV